MNKKNVLKRTLSLALAFVMLLSFVPGTTFASETATDQTDGIAAASSERTTIYISNSGSEWYSGTSEKWPKKDITKIPTYLAQGYNVLLKRGDIWYLPTQSLSLTGIAGTEESPVVLGSYGDVADPKPVIAYLKKIENTAWTLVDAEKSIYKTDVSDMTARGDTDIRVHRLFVNDAAYLHRSVTDYTQLTAEQYCDYGGTLYVRTNGGAPSNVEVTPYYGSGTRMMITDTAYLTIENIHFKGSSALNPVIRLTAPTSNVKIRYCDITHCFYYILQIVTDGDSGEVNEYPEIGHCYMDACFSEAEGAHGGGDHWDVGLTEGITMRDGVDGAWIHHNTIRNMAHAFIGIESLQSSMCYNTTGVRNCIIEDNILDACNAKCARAFNISGEPNLSGTQMCFNNIFRRNRCYDMTTACHLYGQNNLIYSNLFSYVHGNYDADGSLSAGDGVLNFGKGAQPWGFDSIPWDNYASIGNMVINNTFYDMGGGIVLDDTFYNGERIFNNIYANNLIVNYSNDDTNYKGGFHDNTPGFNYVLHNGSYAQGQTDPFVVNGKPYLAEEANEFIGYAGNVSGDPKFETADLSILGLGKKQDFALSNASPYRYAGLALDAEQYKDFEMYSKLLADYTDINGKPYDPAMPSIGAWSYVPENTEIIRITGVKTTINPIGVIAGYPDYWGEDWEEALGLTNVMVTTSDGNIATVAVDWDYTPLGDLSTIGKYVVTGKLVSRAYENPDHITIQRVIYVREKISVMHNGTFDANRYNWTGEAIPAWSESDQSLKLTLPGKTRKPWTVLYSSGYSSASAVSNYAKIMGDVVARQGGGQYYFGFDVKWNTVAQNAQAMDISLQLHGYNAYNETIADAHKQGDVKITLTAGDSAWKTNGDIANLNGTDDYIRAAFVVSEENKLYDGQVLQLDNIELNPLKVNLNVPVDLNVPSFSNVAAAQSNDKVKIIFKVDVNELGTQFTEPYLMVHYKGDNYKIISYETVNEQYVFDFGEIVSYPMDEAVTATMCYTYQDVIVCSEPYVYYPDNFCEDNGHDYKITQTVEPSCTESGYTIYTCAACGETCKEEVSATGHTPADAVLENETAATCAKSGSYDTVIYCATCGVEQSRTTSIIPATGIHTYDNEADADCNVCGAIRERKSITDVEKLLAISVVKDYNTYMTDWKAALALTGKVTVTISDGTVGTADVIWDYSALDLSTPGKYVLTGKLESDKYLNLNDLTAQQVILVTEATNLIFNGNFTDGTYGRTGWSSDWLCAKVTHPTDAGSTVLRVYRSDSRHYYNPTLYQQTDAYKTDLAAKVKEGQYYFAIDMMSVDYDETNAAREDQLAELNFLADGTELTKNVNTLVKTNEWTRVSEIINTTGTYASVTTQLQVKHQLTGSRVPAALYLTNFQLILLKTTLADPATCVHNYVDGVCSGCGADEVTGPAVDENLKFNVAPGLSFKDYIGMQILVTNAVASNYDRVWIEAVQADPAGDVTTILEGVPYFYNIYLKFEQQVLSWSMAENITLTLYAEKDGVTVKGETFSGSVEELALAKIAEYAAANNTAAVTALVDMLNYGAAVQTAFNHYADMLPNTKLGDFAGTETVPTFDAENTKTGEGTVAIGRDSISMQAKVEIQLLFTTNISAYSVSAKVGGADAPVVIDSEKYAAYGWTLVKVAVAADKMRQTYTISLVDAEGNPVTQVLNASVEAYGKAQLGGTYNDVVVAMMRYGDSVAAL